ncbi:hypothetical protein CPB86DRAFT_488968 [Serendipita vermifera]|nr:hypothetical protein CPB86DRAFT_488968 [Serendipita vermifera]
MLMYMNRLVYRWQEADVWHTWRNMTRQKNDIANGVRLENASWRTWWQKRGKLKTVNPQKLNWLKDSDVTWLYGPLHQAPVPVPPPKGASLEEKLNTIPPLPKGRKPILKKRTLAEVLVLGLAKTNDSPDRPPADELKELDIDSRGNKGPEERDRIMLLHTKSDTNLLRPAIGRVQQPSPPGDSEPTKPRRPRVRVADSSSLSMSTKGSTSPPPNDRDTGPRKRVGFNSYVAQCIAIAPGEKSSSDDADDSDEDALSMKSGGSTSHGSNRPSFSRSNSHSSSKSEPLIIAPMAPTLLKETQGDGESNNGPVVYMPIETPFDGKDSDDEFDFGSNKTAEPPMSSSEPPIIEYIGGGEADVGGEYATNNKKRKLSNSEIPPSRRPYKETDKDTTLSLPGAGSGDLDPNGSTSALRGNTTVEANVSDDTRGRTLHRVPSSSSLNERSRSRNGNSRSRSHSPESSRAPSSSTRGSSSEVGMSTRNGRGVTRTNVQEGGVAPPSISESEVRSNHGNPDTTMVDVSASVMAGVPSQEQSKSAGAQPQTKTESSGFVDKAVANARGLIGTLLNSSSSSSSAKR